ncbi:MAG: DUF3631 domain-containing protein [Betaproteobacteria bacterium]|nr:DUF3631 domain-containing protein [Betaproteobacteria bacterium]
MKEYGIASKNLRINCDVVKGFEHEQFKEAFARYLALSPEMPLRRYKSPEANNHAGFDVAENSLRSGNESQAATPKTAPIQGCSGVADILGVSRKAP